jgi:predicted nucleic acid-binding protein
MKPSTSFVKGAVSGSPIVVVDAGVALHAVVPTPLSDAAVLAWDDLTRLRAEVCAPRLFSYQVTSVIHRYEHDGLLTADEAGETLATALGLGVGLVDEDLELCRHALTWATRLHHKPAHDGFYVALADRLGGELWTADRRLTNALSSIPGPAARWIGDPHDS